MGFGVGLWLPAVWTWRGSGSSTRELLCVESICVQVVIMPSCIKNPKDHSFGEGRKRGHSGVNKAVERPRNIRPRPSGSHHSNVHVRICTFFPRASLDRHFGHIVPSNPSPTLSWHAKPCYAEQCTTLHTIPLRCKICGVCGETNLLFAAQRLEVRLVTAALRRRIRSAGSAAL